MYTAICLPGNLPESGSQRPQPPWYAVLIRKAWNPKRLRPAGLQLGVRAPAAPALVRGAGGARSGDRRGRHHRSVAAAAQRLCHVGGARHGVQIV